MNFIVGVNIRKLDVGLISGETGLLRAFALKLEIMMLVEYRISQGRECAQELNSFMFQGWEKGVMLPRI